MAGNDLTKILMDDKLFAKTLATVVADSLTDETKVQLVHSFAEEIINADKHRSIKWAVEQGVKEVLRDLVKEELQKEKWQTQMKSIIKDAAKKSLTGEGYNGWVEKIAKTLEPSRF